MRMGLILQILVLQLPTMFGLADTDRRYRVGWLALSAFLARSLAFCQRANVLQQPLNQVHRFAVFQLYPHHRVLRALTNSDLARYSRRPDLQNYHRLVVRYYRFQPALDSALALWRNWPSV